jgi:apolipoprotein N-acyltransferase
MALAFPKVNGTVFAPLGAAALFYAWYGLSARRAFWVGWVAGFVFFSINFSWFGETVGAEIAPYGFIVTAGPAFGDGFFGFALPGALVALLARDLQSRDRITRAFVPLGAAAIFAFFEWLRSEGLGVLGVPFGSLGLSQTSTVFAPIGSYLGTYGMTFVVCIIGAYLAYAIALRTVRGSIVDAAIAAVGIACVTAIAWLFWPARTVDIASFPVAAIQGNIAQSYKFAPGSLEKSIERYTILTEQASFGHPALVVWPETVIPTPLNRDPVLRQRFAALARSIDAELVVGTNDVSATDAYNALYFFTPDGGLDSIYRKRQLVPFAEHLPFAPLFSWIPLTREISHFSSGSVDGVASVNGVRIAPIICWESAFSDLAVADVRDGADAFIVATDDAWFGTTAGPYMHAQISQMRALETGRWIVRAASTGVSGIIAPNGQYTQMTSLNEQAVVSGKIGSPVATLYDSIGALGIALALALVSIGVASVGRLRSSGSLGV